MSKYATGTNFDELLIYKVQDGAMASRKVPSSDWYYWAGEGWSATQEAAEAKATAPLSDIQQQCDRALTAFLEYRESLQVLQSSVQAIAITGVAENHWAGTLQGIVMASTTLSPEGAIKGVREVFG